MRAPIITQIMEGDGLAAYPRSRYINIKGPPFRAASDGLTDVTAIIQSAMDSLYSGGTILFPQGIYLISSALVFNHSYINIEGCGPNTVIIIISNTENIFEILGTDDHPNDRRGCGIYKIGLQGPGVAATGAGVYIEWAHEATVQNCYIGDPVNRLGSGIVFDGKATHDADNCIIANNFIKDTLQNGISMISTGGGASPATIEENVISGNVIQNTGNNGIACSGNKNTIITNTIEESITNGIVVDEDANIVIGNTCCQCVNHGISIEQLAGTVDFNIVIGNTCLDNDFDNTTSFSGIYLLRATHTIVSGNKCLDNDNYEIFVGALCENNLITGNNVYGNDHVGTIWDEGSQTQIYGNIEDTLQSVPAKLIGPKKVDLLNINGAGTANLSSIGWTDWDLDTDLTVPSNAISIILDVSVRDDGAAGAELCMAFRKNGVAGVGHEINCYCMPANTRWTGKQVIIEMDDDNIVEYFISASGAGSFDAEIKLLGYILS